MLIAGLLAFAITETLARSLAHDDAEDGARRAISPAQPPPLDGRWPSRRAG